MEVLSILLWFSIIVCVAAVMVCSVLLLHQRRQPGHIIVEDAGLLRVLLCAVVIGSASGIVTAVVA